MNLFFNFEGNNNNNYIFKLPMCLANKLVLFTCTISDFNHSLTASALLFKIKKYLKYLKYLN